MASTRVPCPDHPSSAYPEQTVSVVVSALYELTVASEIHPVMHAELAPPILTLLPAITVLRAYAISGQNRVVFTLVSLLSLPQVAYNVVRHLGLCNSLF